MIPPNPYDPPRSTLLGSVAAEKRPFWSTFAYSFLIGSLFVLLLFLALTVAWGAPLRSLLGEPGFVATVLVSAAFSAKLLSRFHRGGWLARSAISALLSLLIFALALQVVGLFFA
jgi:hypothetical protein